LIAGIWIAANWQHVKNFPYIISSFSAKTACSCLFVEGRDEASCRNYSRQYIPIQSMDISAADKIVTVKGLWITNRAKYTGKRYGCILLP
jgi:hypothetical protein